MHARAEGSDDLLARARIARAAVESVGPALLALWSGAEGIQVLSDDSDQLKTAVDEAAEAWVVAFLSGHFPGERLLAEESFTRIGEPWDAPRDYWTVDALDGTRSFAAGYQGFCAQVAYVQAGVPVVGVVHEPVRETTYWAVSGGGAFVGDDDGYERLSRLRDDEEWPKHPRFADSTVPRGPVGALMERVGGKMVECGSIGLKICRVATAEADVFAKALRFKLWDVAPGAAILAEVGGSMGLWDGTEVSFDSMNVYGEDLVVAPSSLFEGVVAGLSDVEQGSGSPSAQA